MYVLAPKEMTAPGLKEREHSQFHRKELILFYPQQKDLTSNIFS